MYKINKEKCIGCGMCATICPEVFELGEDGKSFIKNEADSKAQEDCIKQAIESCPVGAIEKND